MTAAVSDLHWLTLEVKPEDAFLAFKNKIVALKESLEDEAFLGRLKDHFRMEIGVDQCTTFDDIEEKMKKLPKGKFYIIHKFVETVSEENLSASVKGAVSTILAAVGNTGSIASSLQSLAEKLTVGVRENAGDLDIFDYFDEMTGIEYIVCVSKVRGIEAHVSGNCIFQCNTDGSHFRVLLYAIKVNRNHIDKTLEAMLVQRENVKRLYKKVVLGFNKGENGENKEIIQKIHPHIVNYLHDYIGLSSLVPLVIQAIFEP